MHALDFAAVWTTTFTSLCQCMCQLVLRPPAAAWLFHAYRRRLS